MSLRKTIQWVLVAGVLVLVGWFGFSVVQSIRAGLRFEYGGNNINQAIVGFMKANDGEWPAIELYHEDVLTGESSTAEVRKYWSVAWQTDPEMLIQEASADPGVRDPYYADGDCCPVVYNHRQWERGEGPKWFFTPAIFSYVETRR